MLLRRNVWIVNWSALASPIGKTARNTYRAKCIQSICVLHAFSFFRGHLSLHSCTFEGNASDDLADMLHCRSIHALLHQPISGHCGANSLISTMEFPVSDVMQQCSKLRNDEIGTLILCQFLTELPHAIDVPPVVTAFTQRLAFHESNCLCYSVRHYLSSNIWKIKIFGYIA